jgi:hypothetical protein
MGCSQYLKWFVLVLLVAGCDQSDVFVQKGVKTKVVGETVVIENNHGRPISYFAVEFETAQLINWAARSGSENTINNKAGKAIPWGDIMSDGSLQRGDRVIIYWWPAQSGTLTSSEMNQNIIIL